MKQDFVDSFDEFLHHKKKEKQPGRKHEMRCPKRDTENVEVQLSECDAEYFGNLGSTTLTEARTTAASAKVGCSTVRSSECSRLTGVPEEVETCSTPVAQVNKKTKREKSKTQLKCHHITDWHPTERRTLKLSVKQNTSVWTQATWYPMLVRLWLEKSVHIAEEEERNTPSSHVEI